MKRSARLALSRPWRNGLILTTGLSMLMFGASELWSSGLAEWAFVVSFIAAWCLISIFWSNDRYIEGSNQLLAGIVDHNFERIHERLVDLEHKLDQRNSLADESSNEERR